ncbi:hypothetical protein QR680_004694 [Steinernema hermaphroditum]|uniref:G-protein coupled receptors family 1 profile domain-containing protein n=1 Tax=Steinernema hermaphroditum TaxID=289476 RepID=A0AA39HPI7_9BILA|nr:hypothetical protein QR680_004694 [Steinernema hermaphroditum]
MSDSSNPPATVAIRIFGGVSYGLLSTGGITLNVLLVTILIQGRSSFKKNAFYTITWHLAMCDLLTHVMEMIVPVPSTFAGSDIYGSTLFLNIPCFIDTVAYNGTLYFSVLMTVNRFTVFILPSVNNIMFHQSRLYITIACTWLYVILLVVGLNVFACNKSFSSTGFFYYHVCPPWDEMPEFGQFIKIVTEIGSTYLPVAMLITYVVIIIYIRLKIRYEWKNGRLFRKNLGFRNHEAALTAREYSLLAQSLLICGFIEIQNIVFVVLPTIRLSGQWHYVLNFAGNWVSLLLSSIHPIVLFTFNSDIKSRLKRLFHTCFRSPTVTINVASSVVAVS